MCQFSWRHTVLKKNGKEHQYLRVWLKWNLQNIPEIIEKSRQENKTASLVCRISCQQLGTLPTTFSSNAVSSLGFLSLFATNKPYQKWMETKAAWLLKDRQTHRRTCVHTNTMAIMWNQWYTEGTQDQIPPDFYVWRYLQCCAAVFQGVTVVAPAFCWMSPVRQEYAHWNTQILCFLWR